VLAIEGTEDATNARAGHAAFIARHIPGAELWRPLGVGHGVHHQRPFEWIAQLEDFWARRGTEPADRIWRLRRERYGDGRESIFEVRVEDGDPPALTGVVEDPAQHRALLEVVAGQLVEDRVQVLQASAWGGRIARGVVDIVSEPTDSAERVTQALFGEVVRAFDASGRWTRVRLDRDGYRGWVRTPAIVPSPIDSSDPTATTVRDAAGELFVVDDVATAHEHHEGAPVGRIPFGARVSVVERDGDWIAVEVPGGSVWWLHEAALHAPTRVNDPRPVSAVLARFRRFVGVPYLWGGRTPYGFDCSGLSQAFWERLGHIIPRDADQQSHAGTDVGEDRQPGDLLFFHAHGAASDSGITHVAIVLDESTVLHASSSNGAVAVNSLDPASPVFSPGLRETFVGARRFGSGT
jgi:cell wall-associated NlpC family hydrolase